MYNNKITLIEKYMWNCGSCMFIAIQKIPHLNGAKVWNKVFSVFSSCLIPKHDETSDSDTMREINLHNDVIGISCSYNINMTLCLAGNLEISTQFTPYSCMRYLTCNTAHSKFLREFIVFYKSCNIFCQFYFFLINISWFTLYCNESRRY